MNLKCNRQYQPENVSTIMAFMNFCRFAGFVSSDVFAFVCQPMFCLWICAIPAFVFNFRILMGFEVVDCGELFLPMCFFLVVAQVRRLIHGSTAYIICFFPSCFDCLASCHRMAHIFRSAPPLPPPPRRMSLM